MPRDGQHLQGVASVTTAASGTCSIFGAPGSGIRIHLCKGYVSVAYSSSTAAALVSLIETDSTGSDITSIFSWTATTTKVFNFDFGEKGYYLASCNSRLSVRSQNTDAVVNAVCVGYLR